MPMATRTAGASHPRSREYLRKKMAASTSATPATAENSFTPTSCSQSKAFSKEDGPDVGPLSGASIGEAARGSILGGGGTPGGFSAASGGDGIAATGGVTGGPAAGCGGICGDGAATGSRAANGGGGGRGIGGAGAGTSLLSC